MGDPIVVGVTGTQVYGGTPIYAPSYSGVAWRGTDGPAVVTGTLVCSTNATASSPVAGSPYTISGCSGLSAADYQIGYSYGGLTVTAEALIITATPSSTTTTYGSLVPAVTPTYTGLVDGNDAPAAPATCTTTLTAASPVAGSPYATSCSGASDPNYAISYLNGATITVLPRPIAVTVTGTQVYGGNPVYAASYPGVAWVGTDGPSVVTGTLVCSTNATASSPLAGNPYTIFGCSGLSAVNYSIGYSYGGLTVTAPSLVITAVPSSTTMTYGGPVPAVTPIYSGLANGNRAPATPPTCTTTATVTSPVAGSPYATSCSGASDPDYAITYNNTATITVVPRPIVVTVTGTQPYGGTPVYTASYGGVAWVGQDGPSVVSGTLKCSTNANRSSSVAGNPFTISGCSGLSAGNYSIAYSYGALTVAPAPLSITATPASTTMTYGGPVPSVTPTYAGLVNGNSAPAIPPTCTTTARATSPVAGSPYGATCSGASDPNYAVTYNNTATITVLPRRIVVTVTGTQPYGGTPVYTPSYSGVSWVGSDGPAVVTGALTCSTNATASSPVAGNPYTISGCSGLSAANYSIGYSYGALTVTATVPSAPQSVTATAGNGQVTVTWTAPASTGGSAITGYTVTPYIGTTAQASTKLGASAISTIIKSLTNGTAYTFTVAATNGVGTGATATSALVTPATLPGAPQNVTATAGNGQVTVTWAAPASNGGSAIVGYTVTPYIGTAAQAPTSVGPSTVSTTITGLTNGTKYTFKVLATNGVGAGPVATSAAVTPATVPGVPQSVTATAGNGQVTVTWTAPASTGGSAITGYTVTPYIGTTAQASTKLGASAISTIIKSLTNGTAYTFTVAATNGVGTGATATSALVTPATLPGAPQNVTATAGNGQVTVTWAAPASNGGSAIVGYTVTPYIGTAAQAPTSVGPSTVSTTITGLTNGTKYTFKVLATNGVGAGPVATSAAVTPATVPGVPQSVTATAGNGQVTVTWTAPASTGGSAITGYTVTPYIGTTAQASTKLGASAISTIIKSLTNGTAYTFTVAATNGVGAGPAATSSAVTPKA